ncbi:MAG: NADP-dependent oxidoreductase [Candidatus Dormiibacterota bacterium]
MTSTPIPSAAPVNRQWRLAARPAGLPVSTDWEFTTAPVSDPVDGEFLVRVLYISLDPAMRGWMNDRRSYVPPVGIGEVMRAGGLGRVVASRHADFKAGDHVTGTFGVQDYAISDGRGVVRVAIDAAPLPQYLSVLGIPGMTAYFGLLEVGRPVAGETVVVSAAAGAVGQLVGQIAKIKGCRVVGIAGGAEKCRVIVDELRFDAAIDYKSEDVRARLRELCPDRVDVYFDNVGGEILDTVLTRLARHARVVICGSISQYNNHGPARGPANYMTLLVDRARMEGFVVFDYAKRYAEATRELSGWLAGGQLKSVEHVVRGMEHFPETLLHLYSGANFGKLILSVADDEAG